MRRLRRRRHRSRRYQQHHCLLVLADGSKIVLAPNSELALDTLTLLRRRPHGRYADAPEAWTDRGSGQSREAWKPECRIETPSAQAVVRGTNFRLGADDEVTREETVGGLVGVSGAGRSVGVPAGLGTITKAGEAPIKPVPLLAAADVSSLPARFEHLPMRFPLPSVAGAASWQGQVAQDESFDRILLIDEWRDADAGRMATTYCGCAPSIATGCRAWTRFIDLRCSPGLFRPA